SSRVEQVFSGADVDWSKIYTAKEDSKALGIRYQLAYVALAHFIALKANPSLADTLRPQLDAIYRGLIDKRSWKYWHAEQKTPTWPLLRGNLTYAGRLTSFIGFYIDAFGEPPAEQIIVDDRTISYKELSQNLWDQAAKSPNCGVSCFNNVSMVQCNAHLLINNLLHDRLFNTKLSTTNANWLSTLENNLLSNADSGSVFYFATLPNLSDANTDRRAIGTDIWILFLMSGIVPDRVTTWFESWQRNIIFKGDLAYISVGDNEITAGSSSDEHATAWAYCLAKELGQADLAEKLRCFLAPKAKSGFEADLFTSGLFLLGESLKKGAFYKLIHGSDVQ
ncbi:MAG: hypothetical protein HRU28_16990, partial [Rhizobiales bacterium]|nr:hypothetical protein [Hyphomicrobiales bacterium]